MCAGYGKYPRNMLLLLPSFAANLPSFQKVARMEASVFQGDSSPQAVSGLLKRQELLYHQYISMEARIEQLFFFFFNLSEFPTSSCEERQKLWHTVDPIYERKI